jgi:hypothetical protein
MKAWKRRSATERLASLAATALVRRCCQCCVMRALAGFRRPAIRDVRPLVVRCTATRERVALCRTLRRCFVAFAWSRTASVACGLMLQPNLSSQARV